MKTILLTMLGAALMMVGAGQEIKKSPKKGIAYGHLKEADMQVLSQGLSWWYNWYVQPEPGVSGVFENYQMDFVPMIWGGTFDESAIRAFYQSHPNARYLLGFNEPNFTTQSNMGPKKAASLWYKLENIARDYGLKIVGPAVNWCDKCITEDGITYTSPYQYLDTFFNACKNCQIDYIAVHNYMCYSGALADYLEKFKKYGKKIWLTEFACWDQSNITLDMQKSYMMGAIDLLENDTMIFRYSWFAGSRNGGYPYLNLLDYEEGKLTELGRLYLSFYPLHDTSFYKTIPARIEAENYAQMYGVALEGTKDIGGGANIGWIDANDWLSYNIEVPSDTLYYLYFRIAANTNTSIIILDNNNVVDTLGVTSTGGWQNWKTFMLPIPLSSGKHIIKLFTPKGGFNINWIAFSLKENTPPVLTSISSSDTIYLPTNSIVLNCEVTDLDGDSIVYQWEKISGPSNYSINQTAPNAWTISNLVKGKYTFKLTASDGWETISANVNVTVIDPLEVTLKATDLFDLYPIPVNDVLYVRWKQGNNISSIKMSIFDITGKEVKSFKNITSGCIPMTDIKAGTYLVKIIASGQTYHQYIVKN